MKRDSIIVSTFALVAGVCLPVPATASASGPLLSGYGGPGAGSQVVLGSTLLAGGGSGGTSHGGGSGGGSQGAGTETTGTRASAARGSSPSASRQGRGSGPSASGGSATHPGAAGANPKTSSPLVAPASSSVSSPWFSGGDLLALLLAAGALFLVGLATMRIARTQHH